MQRSCMKRSRLVLALGFLALTFLISIPFPGLPQAAPVTLEEPMLDFTLPVYQGGEIKLSDLRVKT